MLANASRSSGAEEEYVESSESESTPQKPETTELQDLFAAIKRHDHQRVSDLRHLAGDQDPEGDTGLALAVRLNCQDCVAALAKSGAKSKNKDGLCASHLAYDLDRIKLLKILLPFEAGATDSKGNTLLQRAVADGKFDVMQLIKQTQGAELAEKATVLAGISKPRALKNFGQKMKQTVTTRLDQIIDTQKMAEDLRQMRQGLEENSEDESEPSSHKSVQSIETGLSKQTAAETTQQNASRIDSIALSCVNQFEEDPTPIKLEQVRLPLKQPKLQTKVQADPSYLFQAAAERKPNLFFKHLSELQTHCGPAWLTALMAAAARDVPLDMLLPEAGMQDKYGRTALCHAAYYGAEKAIKRLIPLERAVTCSKHRTPLHYAVLSNVPKNHFALLVKHYKQCADYAGQTATMLAASLNLDVSLTYLIQKSDEVGMKDRAGQTALQLAMMGRAAISAALLCQLEAKVSGLTQLMIASFFGTTQVVYARVESQARLRDTMHRTALMYAVLGGHVDLVPMLARLEAGSHDAFGMTAMQMAIQQQDTKLISALFPFEGHCVVLAQVIEQKLYRAAAVLSSLHIAIRYPQNYELPAYTQSALCQKETTPQLLVDELYFEPLDVQAQRDPETQ